jgi:hypothetical protein
VIQLCISRGSNPRCCLYIHNYLAHKTHIFLCFIRIKSIHISTTNYVSSVGVQTSSAHVLPPASRILPATRSRPHLRQRRSCGFRPPAIASAPPRSCHDPLPDPVIRPIFVAAMIHCHNSHQRMPTITCRKLAKCPCVATKPYNDTITYVHMCVILL